jgi:hypothetical protein
MPRESRRNEVEAILIVFTCGCVHKEALEATEVSERSQAVRERAHARAHQDVRRASKLVYVRVRLCQRDDVVNRKDQKLRQLGDRSDDTS